MANTDRAWQLFGMHRFDLAEKELYGVLAREPNDAMAHAMLGYVLARRGELSRAHQEIDEAIGRDPESAYAHFVRSWILGSEKKYEAARLAILEALRIWPDSTAYLDQLSWLELCLNRPVPAMEVAQAGLRIDPKHTGCLSCLALAWSYQGQPQRAVEIMDQALSLEPLSSRLHTNLGWIHARAHRPELALEHFCEGLRLEPESADSRAAFQQGVASAVQDWRVLIVLRTVAAGGVLSYFVWGSVWIGVVLVPLVSLLVMLISTTFVLQLFPLGRSLLPEEKQAECRWLNLGLSLVVLGSYLLLAFVPTMYGVGMATAMAALGSNLLALYFEYRPGWPRWRFGLALLAFPLIVGLFDRFFPEDHRAGYDVVLITALIALTYILNLLARVDQESEPYSAIRGLVIREGLQRRAAQAEPK